MFKRKRNDDIDRVRPCIKAKSANTVYFDNLPYEVLIRIFEFLIFFSSLYLIPS